MKVAEIDGAVQGMLEEEYRRCRDVLAALMDKVVRYPKGALNLRKRVVHGKSYGYHYLVLRERGKVVNRHVSEKEIPELQVQIRQRDQCRQEILVYKKRIAYLEKLLRIKQSDGGRHERSV